MTGFQAGTYLQVVEDGGAIDADAMMAPVGAMAEAGITDFRVTLDLPAEESAVQDMLAPRRGFPQAGGALARDPVAAKAAGAEPVRVAPPPSSWPGMMHRRNAGKPDCRQATQRTSNRRSPRGVRSAPSSPISSPSSAWPSGETGVTARTFRPSS